MSDARFEDGREAPLYLAARDADDLKVISALCQDAVFPASEMTWRPRVRRFGLLLNRFRWEDPRKANAAPERVQSVLAFDLVHKVSSQGVPKGDADTVLSLLCVEHTPGDTGGGHIQLIFAGDGAIRLTVEAIDVTLRDVTRPYTAPSGRTPTHSD